MARFFHIVHHIGCRDSVNFASDSVIFMSTRSKQPQNLLIGRDESWMQFNRRVLEEAQDASNPLLERVKMLAISGSNLDEFFEIRVAALLQLMEDGVDDAGLDGLSPAEAIEAIARDTQELVEEQYRCWNQMLRPALAENGIVLRAVDEVDEVAD